MVLSLCHDCTGNWKNNLKLLPECYFECNALPVRARGVLSISRKRTGMQLYVHHATTGMLLRLQCAVTPRDGRSNAGPFTDPA